MVSVVFVAQSYYSWLPPFFFVSSFLSFHELACDGFSLPQPPLFFFRTMPLRTPCATHLLRVVTSYPSLTSLSLSLSDRCSGVSGAVYVLVICVKLYVRKKKRKNAKKEDALSTTLYHLYFSISIWFSRSSLLSVCCSRCCVSVVSRVSTNAPVFFFLSSMDFLEGRMKTKLK